MIYCFSSLYSPLDSGPGTPAQLLAGKAKEVDALAMGFLDTSNNISGEDGVEPLQGRVGEEVEEGDKKGGLCELNEQDHF